jgi:hypothetical protein
VALPADGSIYQHTFTSFGFNWLYFQYRPSSVNAFFSLTLSSSNPMDIFITSDLSTHSLANDPSDLSQPDLEVKGQSRFTLSSEALPKFAQTGFTLAVRVNGANLVNN